MKSYVGLLGLAVMAACSGGGDPPVLPVDAPYLDGDPIMDAAVDAAVDAADARLPDALPDGRPLFDGPPLDGILGDCALAVERVGLGTGTVTSSPVGINCGNACRATFACGTPVTLVAQPAPGSRFVAWGVGCTAGGPTCTVTLTAPVTTVVANFTAP